MKRQQKIGHLLVAGVAVALTLAMVRSPDLAFSAALRGLKLWWEVVFPALLPFFIGSEILMGLGVVHGLGVLLEPLMRPLFDLPGEGAFVVAMGLASGYPIGSVLTARLRRQGAVSKTEGERLMSFANTADPLFMTGAVAVGMFGRPALGLPLMAAHYLAALGVGLLLRFWGRHSGGSFPRPRLTKHVGLRALRALFAAREKDGRPIGQLVGDAIRDSVNTLLLVGGFIILFAVIIRILGASGLLGLGERLLAPFTGSLGPGLRRSLLSGFFEITIGAQEASRATGNLPLKLAVTSAIIAWSGLSVLAQVAAIIQDTDLSLRPYVLARVAHGLLAGLLAYFLTDALVLPASLAGGGASYSFWSPDGLLFLAASLLLAALFGMFRRSIRGEA